MAEPEGGGAGLTLKFSLIEGDSDEQLAGGWAGLALSEFETSKNWTSHDDLEEGDTVAVKWRPDENESWREGFLHLYARGRRSFSKL